jgi:hypothetical protein
MGLKTDFMSLGAIGLGTAVAVIGTGGLLVAGAVKAASDTAVAELEESERCMSLSIASVARAPEAPQGAKASDGKVARIRIVDGDVNVDVSDLHELGEAPLDVDLRVDCVAEFGRDTEARVRVISDESARLDAELRGMAEEIRAEVELLRAEARAMTNEARR